MRLSIVAAAALSSLASSKHVVHDPFPMPPCKGIIIEDASIVTLQQWMIDGNLTSQDLVECYLDRIEQTDKYLHSISEINPDALAIAAAMDAERAIGTFRGPMHGIPFLVKDNYYTDDKHNTSEGTLVLLGGRYSSEATVVTKVREAGGVLVGHSTMSEAADHRALSDYASGYSSRTGQTRNPYNLTQSTAGSSSGSVVAVRSNQIAIALGTETHGSLTHPSAQLGLYTIKSTPGLMSRHGIVTGSYYHDTPGPLARSMKDVAILLDIMAGPDRYDNLTFQAIGHYPEAGYAAEVAGKDTLPGLKLGLPWDPYWSTNAHVNSPGHREKYEARFEELKAAGAEVYNITYDNPFAEIANPYGIAQPANIAPEFNHLIAFSTLMAVGYHEWLQNWTFPEDDPRVSMSTLAEMAAWNDAHNATTGALGNNTWWWDPETGQSFYDRGVATNGSMRSEFWTAFGWGRFTARQAIDSSYAYILENGTVVELDGLLVPNGRGGGYDNGCASVPSYAGYPIAAVPTGLDAWSTPFGMCVYGRQYGEAQLVKVASAMEDLFQWNEKPGWFNYETAKGPWDQTWPGYTCSEKSLEYYSCEPEA
ncbi:amidase signature domain-containing protein [Aspergillus filifer]